MVFHLVPVSIVQVFLIASRLRRQGVRLFTVGVDGQIDRVELRAIATNPDSDHFFHANQPEGLVDLANNVTKRLCRDLKRTCHSMRSQDGASYAVLARCQLV